MTDSIDRTRIRVWTGSAQEQVMYLISTFGDWGTWEVESQSLAVTDDGVTAEDVNLRQVGGSRAAVRFLAIGDSDDFAGPSEDDQCSFLNDVTEGAATFSADNPPHHPGTLARFPVPSASYADALAVPMPVLAQGQGERGIYAPPRVAVLSFPSLTPVGVGEFPDFDPEDWPPPRLGDWPPAATQAMSGERLHATLSRFSACWFRVLSAWFGRESQPTAHLASDIRSSLEARDLLDVPSMDGYYDRLNPVFARWLKTSAKRDCQADIGTRS